MSETTEKRFEQIELGDPEPEKPERDSTVFEKMVGKPLPERFRKPGFQKEDHLHRVANRKVEALPTVEEACGKLVETVNKEEREDISVPLKDMFVDEEGRFARRDGGEIAPGLKYLVPTEAAWRALAMKAPESVLPGLKSNVNGWLQRKQVDAITRTMRPTESMRLWYGLVSDRYAAHDANEIAKEVAETLDSDCKGRVKYEGNGGRYEISAILPRPFDVEGDLHQVIVSVRSADNGTLSKQIHFKAYRLACTNGISIVDGNLIAKMRHIGDEQELREMFSQSLEMANEAMESFRHLWGYAKENQFFDRETGEKIDNVEAMKRLCAEKVLHVPHVRPPALFEKVYDSFTREPGESIADVVNAVTRTAWENANDWKSPWYEEDLEEQGGQLLYNYLNYQYLPALDDDQWEAFA